MINKSQRWQRTAMALATATVLGMWSSQATALSLGGLVVQSALGEPLRAEIEVLDITEAEADTLRPRVAPPEAFRTSGMDYSAALNGLQISLQRRADGRRVLRLTNVRPVNDPFVDLILEASWSSGRIMRDYTMLFDPPNLSAASNAAAPQAPQVSAVPVRITPSAEPTPAGAPAVAAAAPTEPQTNNASEPAAPATTPAVSATAPAETVAAAPAAAASTPAAESTEKAGQPATETVAAPPAAAPTPVATSKKVTVKAGDTASKIAMAQKPTAASLDQMLVAMLRANPQAFIGGNINRVKTGAVLAMPGQDEVQATSADEAHQTVLAQSKDFNEFRRQLAASAPVTAEKTADRQAGGTVQTQVEEKKPSPTAPDKLTLSKGSVQTKSAEDKLAEERSAKEAAARAAAIAKNVAELEKLSKAATPAPAASAPKPAAGPATVTAPTTTSQPTASATAPTASAPQAGEAPAPAASPASAATPAAPRRPAPAPAAPAPTAEEPSLIDELLEEPLIPAAGGGLVLLLLGYAVYRSRQRRKSEQVDSAYLESRLQPDSFFGASGGQRVDTNDAGASSSSSMVYSPSQLDAGDDVDPVAEADVYLAYGRDLQAEEILKEALRTQSGRVAIHQKLCEIYAKRRDAKNFGNIAKDAHRLTGGSGPEWEQISNLGLGIDPENSMYHPGGEPSNSGPAPLSASAPAAAAPTPSPAPRAAPAPAPAAAGGDLDLDLDFSLDEPQVTVPVAATAPAPMAVASGNSLEFEAPSLPQISPAAAAPAPAGNSMNFDLGGLSLDLGAPSEQPDADSNDPLATKLALADEFKAIGDTDGARALIEEIIAEASGDMKSRAQQALAALG